jgi:hypothetical protein
VGVKAFIPNLRDAPRALVSVAQNFGWMLASRGVSAVFSLVYLAIVTRSLGVEGFGKFALITGAAQLLANLLASRPGRSSSSTGSTISRTATRRGWRDCTAARCCSTRSAP